MNSPAMNYFANMRKVSFEKIIGQLARLTRMPMLRFNLTDCCCFRVRITFPFNSTILIENNIGGIGGISDWGPDPNIHCTVTMLKQSDGNSAHKQARESIRRLCNLCEHSLANNPSIAEHFLRQDPNPPFICSEAKMDHFSSTCY